MSTSDFEAIAQFVEDELDFATSHYNDNYLNRRFKARTRRAGADDYGEYLDILREDPAEQEALLGSLSVNVTGFFRNPDVWAGLAEQLGELAAKRDELRLWSAACADGREAYSLAMIVLDHPAIDPDAVTILATDINEEALSIARNGVYESSKSNEIAPNLEFVEDPKQYVQQEGDSFIIRDTVKDLVTFEYHDLIRDEPKADFDCVLCRNMFIYVDNEYKVPVMETLLNSLNPGSIFTLGKAEGLPPQCRDPLETVDPALRLYRYVPDNGA